MALRYAPQAISDLQRLYEFVAPKSPLAAKKAAIDIQEGAERLKLFPRIGLPVSRAPDPDLIRDFYIGEYTIRYQIVSSDDINVLRIWHNKEVEKDL